MCGRLQIAEPELITTWLRQRGVFVAPELEALQPSYNVAPTLAVPVLLASAEGELRGGTMIWGLWPHWSKTKARHANARSETVWEKPTFRGPVNRRRCVLLANAFYEWHRDEKDKPVQAFHIPRSDAAPLAMAALWDWSADKSVGEVCLLTTSPNATMMPIHDRMPCLLDDAGIALWLDPASPKHDLIALLEPTPDDWLSPYPVSNFVNNARNDSPACLATL